MAQLRRSDRIIGGGAIALFIFMFFFKWYGVSSNVGSIGGFNVNVSRTGWQTFTNSRWIWLITIVVALGLVALRAAQQKIDSPVEPSVLVAGLGALSTLLILYRILHHPTASASVGSFHASVGIKLGIWLGLIAAAAITYGGYLAMQDEGTSLADVREHASNAMSSFGSSSATPAPSTTGAAAPVTSPQQAPPSTPVAPAAPPAPPLPPPAAAPDAGSAGGNPAPAAPPGSGSAGGGAPAG